MRLAIIAFIVFAVLLIVRTAEAHVTRIPARCESRPARLLCSTHFHRDRTNHLRVAARAPRIVYQWYAERHPAQRARVLRLWVKRQGYAERLLRAYEHSQESQGGLPVAWLRGAFCVHRYEGAWNANTGNSFYGGFQYLQSTWEASGGLKYASRADLASPHDQLLVTYHVTSRYGWGQWPNTARMCGLL